MNEKLRSDAASVVTEDAAKPLGQVIAIDEGLIKGHLNKVVVTTVEETLNARLDAEEPKLCSAKRYERSLERVDTLAAHYQRQLLSRFWDRPVPVREQS